MTDYVAGETAAFRTLFARHAGGLLRLMLRELGTPEEARDLVQQTFLQLHRARHDYDSSQRFKPWLVTIALNLKREYFRRLRRRPETPVAVLVEPAAPGSDHDALVAHSSLDWALGKLPEEHRRVIELHWFHGLSFAEVAECVGISRASAKLRAHRGYVRLRELLAADGLSRNPVARPGI
jgi:RNA polymerase sigma-70 factor, ECF subfamily